MKQVLASRNSESQIAAQIKGQYEIQLGFIEGHYPEVVTLMECEDKYYLKPIFLTFKEISKEQFDEIMDGFDKSIFEQRRGVWISTMTYDEFFEKFYN